MIRQLCPHCHATVELPESAAGGTADCPACGKPIAVPAGYVPTVAPASALPPPPAPPPGLVPPAAVAPPVRRPVAPSPAWLAWLPAVGLTLAFLASFVPWAGSYPGGVRVYSQTPWQAAVGTFTTAFLPDDLTADEAGLRTAVGVSGWLLLYLPLLLAAVALAWADRLVPAAALAAPPPRLRWLAAVAPHRHALLAGVATLTLALLLVQALAGFGLERAAVAAAEAKFAGEYKDAGDNPNKQTRAKVKAGFEANRLGVEATTARDVAVLAHLLAAGGAAAAWWLHRRGDRPLPRLAFVR